MTNYLWQLWTVVTSLQWWDTRRFSSPVETVILDPDNQDPGCQGVRERAFTPSILEYDPTIPARYMVWQNWAIFWVNVLVARSGRRRAGSCAAPRRRRCSPR